MKNPAVIVGAVILGLFILMMRKGGGGSTAGLEYSIKSQEIYTRGNVEAARINAEVQKAGIASYTERMAQDYAYRLGIIDSTNRFTLARREIDSVERIAEQEIGAKLDIATRQSNERLAIAEKHYAYQNAELSSSERIAMQEIGSRERLQADANKYGLALPQAQSKARREIMEQDLIGQLIEGAIGGIAGIMGGGSIGAPAGGAASGGFLSNIPVVGKLLGGIL